MTAPTIAATRPDDPDALALIGELTAELALGDYAPEATHGYGVEDLVRHGVYVVVARVDGLAVGCGGVQLRDEPGGRYGELKRMYVRASHRGSPVAGAVLRHLLDRARAQGAVLVRRETGVRQAAAIRFYRRHGFTDTGAFGDYRPHPDSLYLERPA